MDFEREQYWRRRLPRLRLHPGAEPIGDQVDRLRRVTVAVSLIPAAIGAVFFLIFAGFGRPDIGAGLVAVVILPIVGLAWVDFARTRAGAAAFLRDRARERDEQGVAPGD